MYLQLHGDRGTPVFLLRGGVLTIELSFGETLPALAA